MATKNTFDLLIDDDAEDLSQLAAAQKAAAQAEAKDKKGAAQAQPKKPAQAQLPSKPAPPSQAVREARTESGRGGGRGGGRGYGRVRGGNGFNRDSYNESSIGGSGAPIAEEGESGKPSERRGPRGPSRGGRRGGFSNGDAGEGDRPRRVFERRSGTGRGNEMKRGGAGSGNWGTPADELSQVNEEGGNDTEKNLGEEKPVGEEEAGDANKENANEAEEKEPEDKEMTLEEYEKVLEEKRKALQALKTAEERKVDAKEFESMQLLSNKKENDDIFIKLGSQKDKRRETSEKDEKVKKSVSINEFLKPGDGEGYYRGPGRGRGRGRGSRGGFGYSSNVAAPAIEDPGQFPTLGGK